MNRSPNIIIMAPVPPKRRSRIWRTLKLILFLGLAFGSCALLFAFAIKYTEEYACVLKFVKEDKTVLQTVGEPVEPGLFAWTLYFTWEGSVRQTAFSFRVTGPKGHGQVKARTYRAPVGSSMFIHFEGQEIYNGVYSCP